MAKHCAVCNQSYPENLPACPHCKAANPEARNEDVLNQSLPFLLPGDSGVDLGKQPPAKAGDSATSDQALQALLADEPDEILEVLPEASSASGKKPVDVHAVDESHVVTPVDVHAVDESILDIVPEDAPSATTPAPPAVLAADDVVEILPEDEAAPPAVPIAADSIIEDEVPMVLEPVSSISGKVPLVAETVESPSDILVQAAPEAAPPVSDKSTPAAPVVAASESVIDVASADVEPASSISGRVPLAAEAVETPSDILSMLEEPVVAEPASSVSGKEPLVAEAVETPSDILSMLEEEPALVAEPASSASGKQPPVPESVEHLADMATLVDEAVFDVPPLDVAGPVSSGSGDMAADVVTLASVETPLEAPPASAVFEVAPVPPAPAAETAPPAEAASLETVDDLPGGKPADVTYVSEMPNLELDSKIYKPGAPVDPLALDMTEVLDVSEEASGTMTPPRASPDSDVTVPEESAGVLGEEVLDVTEEASSGTLQDVAALAEPAPGAAKDSDVSLVDSDVLDAEEVAEVEPDSKTVRSPIRPDSAGKIADLNETVTFEAAGKTADEDVLGHDVVVEGESAVNLAKDSGKAERPGVDFIAEALESGVDLASASKPVVPPRRTSEVDIGGPEYDDVPESAVNLGASLSAPVAKKKEGSAAALDEQAIEDLLMGPDEPTSGAKSGKAGAVEIDGAATIEHEMFAEPPEAEAEAEPEAVAEEEAEVAPSKGKKGAKVKAPKPRRARYLVLGMFLGILLVGGAAAGAWFVDPAREQALELLGLQKKVVPTPVQLAHGFMDKGEYTNALGKLEGAGSAPEVASARAQARWLKYLQANKGKDVDPKADDVKKAQDDAKIANNELLQQEIKTALDAQDSAASLAEAKGVLTGVQKALTSADGKAPEVKELPTTVGEVVKAREEAEQKVAAVAKVVGTDDPKKFGETIKDLSEAKAVIDAVEGELKVKRDAVVKTVKDLSTARTELDGMLKEIDDKLAAAKVDGKGAAGVEMLVETRKKLDKERTDLDALVKSAFDVLKEENLTPPGAEPSKGLLEATKLALEKARTPLVISLGQMASAMGSLGADVGGVVQRSYDVAKLTAELTYYRGREPLIQTPEQKLDTWAALLQDRGHNTGAELTAATNEAQWVLANPRASAEAKARAQYVIGLAERNRGKFEEARKALQQAADAALAAKAAWAPEARKTHAELTAADAYYLPRAQRLYAAGDLKAALADLDTAVQVYPEDGRVLALRGLVRLDLTREGRPDAEAQKLIRQDAEAAQKDARTRAEGLYVLGRLEEALGDYEKAEKAYRDALQAHQGKEDAASSRYIIALARVLQRERGAAPEAPPAEPEAPKKDAKETKIGRRPAEDQEAPTQVSAGDPRLALLVMLLTGFQSADDEEDPETAARIRESIELANKLLKSSDRKIQGEGYILLGKAYTRQGDRTKGLQFYVKGMQMAYPGAATRDLLKLVEEHPGLQGADRVGPPNSFLADRHFGRGLHYFWQGEYPAAEEQFRKAVAYFEPDARYHYYLGLARVLQGTRSKREAARYSFEKGARLEAENRPGPVMVNASLERLQGQLREYLDNYRRTGP